MTYLSRDHNDLIQRYLKSASAKLDRIGLDLNVGANLHDCRAAYYKIPGHIVYPNTHDPDQCHLTPGNSFWASFDDRKNREPVALGAFRVVETRSLIGEMYTHRVFGNLHPVVDAYDINLQDGLPDLAGRLGTTGGIVTHTDWQGRGLGSMIARVIQALAIRHFEIDFQFSFTIDNPDRRRLVRDGYGINHSVLATVGITPINGKNIGVMLNWGSRQELLARMKQELGGNDPGPLKAPARVGYSDYASVKIRKRRHEADIPASKSL